MSADDVVDQTEFKYDELNNEAKRKAREWYAEGATDYDWYDHVYEDAETMGKLLGIEIETNSRIVNYRDGSKKSVSYLAISFSGFCSQGDGCCWSGKVKVAGFEKAVASVNAETNDEELLALALQAETIFRDMQVHYMAGRLRGPNPDNEFEELVQPSEVAFSVDGTERYFRTSSYGVDDCYADFENKFDEFVGDFADWIYKQLEAEYDHITSDEVAEESIRENEYIFDEFGSII